MKSAKITYSNGDVITTSINGTDENIKKYFKVGKIFNIGNVTDNLQSVVKCEIIDSQISETEEDLTGRINTERNKFENFKASLPLKKRHAIDNILTPLDFLDSIDDVNISMDMVRVDLLAVAKMNIEEDNELFIKFINEKRASLDRGICTHWNLYLKALETAYKLMLDSRGNIEESGHKIDYYRCLAIFINCKLSE